MTDRAFAVVALSAATLAATAAGHGVLTWWLLLTVIVLCFAPMGRARG